MAKRSDVRINKSDGSWTIPSYQRANGTWTKEIGCKPGFTPDLEQRRYVAPALRATQMSSTPTIMETKHVAISNPSLTDLRLKPKLDSRKKRISIDRSEKTATSVETMSSSLIERMRLLTTEDTPELIKFELTKPKDNTTENSISLHDSADYVSCGVTNVSNARHKSGKKEMKSPTVTEKTKLLTIDDTAKSLKYDSCNNVEIDTLRLTCASPSVEPLSSCFSKIHDKRHKPHMRVQLGEPTYTSVVTLPRESKKKNTRKTKQKQNKEQSNLLVKMRELVG